MFMPLMRYRGELLAVGGIGGEELGAGEGLWSGNLQQNLRSPPDELQVG
jgi:hypothetical protein